MSKNRSKTVLALLMSLSLLASLFLGIHVSAEYNDPEKVTINIDACGGLADESGMGMTAEVYPLKVNANEEVETHITVYPDKLGDKIPNGLYTGKNGTGDLISNRIESYEFYNIESQEYTFRFKVKLSENTTYYVNWTDPIYLKYDLNGGSTESGLFNKKGIYSQRRAANAYFISNNPMENLSDYNFKREGYVFEGWSDDKEATTGKTANDLIYNESTTVYAIWSHTHNEKVEIPAVDATCTEPGSTAGAKCSFCGEIVKAPETIDPLGHDYKDGVCTRCGAEDPDYVKPLPDGLNQIDGEWVYIRDNIIATDFNGLVKHDNDFWYIENGKANFEYTGLVNSSPIEGYNDIRWYWVTKGVFDKTHNGAEPYLDRGTYLVENGYIDFHKTTVFYNEKTGQWMVFENGMFSKNANGIYQNKYGWWKATNGIVNFKENGVFQNSFGWWRVKDSKVDFNAQGIYQNNFGWWKTTNGKVTFKENGVFQNEFGWWKVKDSKVDFSFTGIASNKYGSWYIKGGKVDFSKNGKVNYNNKTYTIKNGKVV